MTTAYSQHNPWREDPDSDLRDKWERNYAARNGDQPKVDPATMNPDATVGTTRGSGATPFVAGHGYARRFPTEALPPPMRAYVRDIAKRKQVPVDLPAVTMLGILGGVSGPRIIIRRDLDWLQPTNLYVLSGLSSGAGKSPTVDELRRPLFRIAKQLAESHERAIALKIANLKDEATGLHIQANDEKTSKADQEQCRARAQALDDEAAELRSNPPSAPCLVFDGDTTIEALGESMAANDGAGMIVDDEGTFLRNLAGAYSGGKTGNLGLVLVGYDCRFYKPKRTGRSAGAMERAALSLVISPQPGIIADLIRNQVMDELGFVNRFIVCVPGELTGQRADRPSTYYQDAPDVLRMDKAGREWWAGLLAEVAAYPVIGSSDPEEAATIDLSRAAWKRHVEYERAFEARIHPETGTLRKVSPWATKHLGRVLRIAALLHLAAGQTTDDELTEKTMEDAIVIGEWAIEHFLAVGKVCGLSAGAGRIKEYVDGTEAGFASRTAIANEVFKKNEPASQISAWIDELVATGEYEVGQVSTDTRPKTVVRRAAANG